MEVNKSAVTAWCLYDWASSAFSSIVTTFIFATYFTTKIAADSITGTYQWANAASISGIFIAILSPVFGAIADYGGKHKYWLFVFTYTSAISTALLWFAYPTQESIFFTLTIVIIATITYEIAQVFYNSFLLDLVPKTHIGRISGIGWGLGYIGGIVALAITLFLFIEPRIPWLTNNLDANIRICGPFVALWYGVFALPIFIMVPSLKVVKRPFPVALHEGLKRLYHTVKKLPGEKNILLYLIARMFYIDGLNTVFAFGGIYAAGTFGMSFQKVLLFGITMNIAAGIGALSLSFVDDWIGPKKTIMVSIGCLIIFGGFLVFVEAEWLFWIASLCLCIFVGPVQSASRSLMVRLIVSKSLVSEMFGLYALSGRVTAFLGPWILGVMTYHFASQRVGIGSILFFFAIGGILLSFVAEKTELNLATVREPNRES